MQDNTTPKKGCILVSKPLIDEGFFEQSIIYITAHDSEGSLGFAFEQKIFTHGPRCFGGLFR